VANLAKKSNKPTALATMEDELAQYAQAESDREQMPTGNFVSLKAGVLSVGGAAVKDNTLNAVVVDSVYENHLYEGDYDPDKPASPVCFAFAHAEGELVPHEKSTKPQSENCASCPHNVFGTAIKRDGSAGKGKACKNVRRLAIIPADSAGDADTVASSEVFYMKLPVTSCKGWAYYTKALAAAMKRPPFAVTTEIKVVPDATSQFKVMFSPGDLLPEDVVRAVMEKRSEVAEQIMAPYTPVAESDEPPKPKAKAPAIKGKKF
jgi:hypothetical protein